MIKYDGFRFRLYEMLQKEPDLPKSSIVQRFIAFGVSRATVFRWIQRYEKTGNVDRLPHSGRPPRIATKSTIQMLKKKVQPSVGLLSKGHCQRAGLLPLVCVTYASKAHIHTVL